MPGQSIITPTLAYVITITLARFTNWRSALHAFLPVNIIVAERP